MSETTETVLDTTPNKKWSLMAVRKETRTRSSLHFKITNGTKSDVPLIRRLNRKTWKIGDCSIFTESSTILFFVFHRFCSNVTYL